MTLLEEWQEKKSWDLTYPFVPVYQSYTTGFKDLDLRNVLQQEETITLNRMVPSGFSEVAVGPADFPRERIKIPVEMPDTVEKITKRMIEILREAFSALWDSKETHLIFCSGGRDSRILAWILKDMYDDGFDLGAFQFVNHEPEQAEFKAVMKEMEWPEEYYYVYKEDALDKPDYYQIPDINYNINGFIGSNIIFHSNNVIEKETVLTTGSWGGELLDYPVYRNKKISFGQFLYYIPHPRTFFSDWYYNWKDILMPYSSYEYLNFVFQIPDMFFKPTGEMRKSGGDLLRDNLLKHFNDSTPAYYRHEYNKQLSEETIERINKEYVNSKFCVLFGDTYAQGILPTYHIFDRWHMHSKLYGLATVIEGMDFPEREKRMETLKDGVMRRRRWEEWMRADRLVWLERYHKEKEKSES